MKETWKKLCAALIVGSMALPLSGQTGEIMPITSMDQGPAATEVTATGKCEIRRGFAEVICAEITADQKPAVEEEASHDASPYKEKTCWAQIILVLPEGRGLSRFDFALKANGEVYPCMAVAFGDTPYSMAKESWILAKERDAKIPVRLLFAVSNAQIQGNDGSKLVSLTLERVLPGVTSKIGADVLQFRLMPAEKPLTTAEEAKKYADEKGGSYGMTYAHMTTGKQSAAPAAPATPAPAAQQAATPATPAPAAKPAAPASTPSFITF